ncbi:MAG TPA: NAD(P)H-hydrate epimerase [Candidatus Omnitrophota bacterium]|nr:NAD(P)H-hydrate epimerase [Candidatus Omnitrophota bacterium]
MMKKYVTVKEIQRLDRIAIDHYKIPSLFLMENAGRAVAREVVKFLKKKNKNGWVSVFCGTGNNGGDGLVAARYLKQANIKIKVFLIGKKECLKNDAAVNYRLLNQVKCPVAEVSRITKPFIKNIAQSCLIVDALFGVGLNREVTSFVKEIIELLNKSQKNIFAVDIPSGLDGTTGVIHGVCIKAQKTVTFTFAKKGFFLRQGPQHVGQIVVVPIGIPKKITHDCF